jgi:uncharacterized protein (TIGR02099 family)
MIHLFKSAGARALRLALAGLILAAVLSGALRLALPFADSLREPVEDLLEGVLGHQVEMERLELSLAGWVPGVTLHGARLIDPDSGRTQLSLAELRLALDPLTSARDLAPRIASLTLVGAHLVVRREADGGFRVAGLEGIRAGSGGALTFFLGNGRFLLSDSRLDLVDAASSAPPLALTDVAMRFDNAAGRHRVGGTARFDGAPDGRLRVAADLTGPAGRPGDWEGTLYARLQGVDLGVLLAGRLPRGIETASSGTDLEAWAALAGGRVGETLARVGLDGLTASRVADEATRRVHLTALTALVHWQSEPVGWRLTARDLHFRRGTRSAPATELDLRLKRSGDGAWSLAGGMGAVDLALAAHVATLLEETPAAVAQAQLEGLARGLRGRLDRRGDGTRTWSARADMEGLETEPVGRAPGLRGLSGRLVAGSDGATLDLDAQGLSIDLPWLIRGPIALDALSGVIRLRPGREAAWRIEAPDLIARTADVRTRSRVRIDLPPEGGRPFLDLQTDFEGGFNSPETVARYIPAGILKPDLIRWLDHAFPSARVPQGTLIFRGDPGDFPFREHQGRMLVDFAVEDGVLKYLRAWPPLAGVAARVRFDGAELTVEGKQAQFLATDLTGVTARIPDLFVDRTLCITGRAEGPFADAVRVLRETPLAGRFGSVAAPFRAEGQSRLDLAFSLPLRKRGEPNTLDLDLDGRLSWPDPAALTLPEWGVELSGLDGELRFTQEGLSAEAITGDLWGARVALRVETRPSEGEGNGRITRVHAEGRHPVAALAERLPSPLWEVVQGELGWGLDIGVRAADLGGEAVPLTGSLRSDLRGLAVELPAPAGKPAEATRGLDLAAKVTPGEGLSLTGSYGELGLGARFTPGDDGALRPAAALIRPGGAVSEAPAGEGLRIEGRLTELDLNPWLALQEARPAPPGGTAAAEAEALPLRGLDLRVGRLRAGDLAVSDLHLQAEPERDAWRGRLTGKGLEGEVRVPQGPRDRPLEVHLARLDLADVLSESRGEDERSAETRRASDPRRVRALDLHIDDLLWRANSLGTVTVRTSPRADGLSAETLELTGPGMSFRGRGAWVTEAGEARSEVRLAGEWSDLGDFLRRLELESLVDKAPGTLNLELAWPGGPADLSLAALKGQVVAELGAGSLLQVEPGVGRMLGILNLAALQRRLNLDFSDLFDKGHAFEQITGSVRIADGEALIERLELDGPSATISVSGKTDLLDRRFDQSVTVTPRISTGVAVASAVAGGPLVGAAVYLADRVSGGGVDRLGRHSYEVTGPWEDPDIRLAGGSVRATDPSPAEDATSEPAAAVEEPAEEENLFLEHHR